MPLKMYILRQCVEARRLANGRCANKQQIFPKRLAANCARVTAAELLEKRGKLCDASDEYFLENETMHERRSRNQRLKVRPQRRRDGGEPCRVKRIHRLVKIDDLAAADCTRRYTLERIALENDANIWRQRHRFAVVEAKLKIRDRGFLAVCTFNFYAKYF